MVHGEGYLAFSFCGIKDSLKVQGIVSCPAPKSIAAPWHTSKEKEEASEHKEEVSLCKDTDEARHCSKDQQDEAKR